MPSSSYDLVVVGSDFAGLVAATLCARRGLRTLILLHGEPALRYAAGPFRLPVEPLNLPGRQSPAVRRVIEELHFDHALKRRLQPARVGFQVAAPDARLDVHADPPSLLRELDREVPATAAAAAAACEQAGPLAAHFDAVLGQDADFPPTGFWARREVGKSSSRVEDEANAWWARVGGDPLAESLLALPSVLGSHALPEELSAAAVARNFHVLRQGAPRLRGDWEALREIFLEKYATHNGELRAGRAAELLFSWGKINGVRLENGEEVGAGQVIAALSLDDLVPLADKKAPKRLRECQEAIQPGAYRYTLNLVCDEAGVPEGMAPLLLAVADPGAPLIGDNCFAIQVGEPDDSGRVVVTLSAVCPAPDSALDAAEPLRSLARPFAALRTALRERVEMVMPFLGRHVLLAHSPDEAAGPEGALAEAVVKGLLPFELRRPRPLWRSQLAAALGVSAAPYSVGIKNLTLASTQILPQLGIEGEFAAGWCAARIACGLAGKKRDYLKDEVLSSAG